MLLWLPLAALGTATCWRAFARTPQAENQQSAEASEQANSAQTEAQAGPEQRPGQEQEAASAQGTHQGMHEEQEAQRRTTSVEPVLRPHWWEVLEVAPQAPLDELKRAYRSKVRLYHPDRLTGLAPELIQIAEHRTRELNLAFEQAKQNVSA